MNVAVEPTDAGVGIMDPISPTASFPFAYPTSTGISPAVLSTLPAADQVILSSAEQYGALGTGVYAPASSQSLSTAVDSQLTGASLDGQMVGSLLAGLGSSDVGGTFDPTQSLLGVSTTYSMLNTMGSTALNYQSPSAPSIGGNLNALA